MSVAAAAAEHRYPGFDGRELGWRALGDGPPVILVHGLFSHGELNWLRFGHATASASRPVFSAAESVRVSQV